MRRRAAGGGNILPKKILLVDDEPFIIKGLKRSLEQDGYDIDSAADGEEALAKFESAHYDMILLDVMLPNLSGIEVCQRIRETSNVPIIMLTAKGEDMDKILGLEYGADDYMTKPFNILEVKTRIKTIFRRMGGEAQQEGKKVIRARNMVVNIPKRTVTIDDRDINLTVKEFDLLQVLITNRGRIFDRKTLVEMIWKYEHIDEKNVNRTIDVHIHRLRDKIETNPTQPEYILTSWGKGYLFTDKEK